MERFRFGWRNRRAGHWSGRAAVLTAGCWTRCGCGSGSCRRRRNRWWMGAGQSHRAGHGGRNYFLVIGIGRIVASDPLISRIGGDDQLGRFFRRRRDQRHSRQLCFGKDGLYGDGRQVSERFNRRTGSLLQLLRRGTLRGRRRFFRQRASGC